MRAVWLHIEHLKSLIFTGFFREGFYVASHVFGFTLKPPEISRFFGRVIWLAGCQVYHPSEMLGFRWTIEMNIYWGERQEKSPPPVNDHVAIAGNPPPLPIGNTSTHAWRLLFQPAMWSFACKPLTDTLGVAPLPVIVAIRTIPFLLGVSYKPSFATARGPHLTDTWQKVRKSKTTSSWWFQPISKILVKLNHFPR